jgi:hypothetical protein
MRTAVYLCLFGLGLIAGAAAQTATTPLFLETTTQDLTPLEDHTSSMALGDIDNDGDLDLIVGNGFTKDAYNKLYLNNGNGWFVDYTPTHLPHHQATTRALVLGDLDGDGDLDLVMGNKNGQNRLYLNKGRGDYLDATTGRIPLRTESTEDLLLFDVDGDKDLDLVVINDLQQNRLLLNDGKANFTDAPATALPLDQDAAWDAVAGDVDGDGDTDFLVGKWGPGKDGQNRLYLNNGKGVFTDATATSLPAVVDSTFALALGDVDGDGDPDLVVGNSGLNTLLLNDGKGVFSAAPANSLPADPQLPGAIVLVDLDGDGDLDMLTANTNLTGGRNVLFMNDGKGVFTDITKTGLPPEFDGTMCLACGDVDADGDQDVLIGNVGEKGQQNRLYRNLTTQVTTPLGLYSGEPYRIRVYSRPDAGTPLLLLLPLIASRSGNYPIPGFGVLKLDYTLMVSLAPLYANPATNYSEWFFQIPKFSGIVGMRLYVQALVQAEAGKTRRWHFTNMVSDVVARKKP